MQLNKNKYFKEILKEANKLGSIPTEELLKLDRQKALIFSFEDITLDITRQLISSKQFSKLLMLGRAIDIEDEKKKLFDGSFINSTEDQYVNHFLERKPNLVMKKVERYKSFISFLKQKNISQLKLKNQKI